MLCRLHRMLDCTPCCVLHSWPWARTSPGQQLPRTGDCLPSFSEDSTLAPHLAGSARLARAAASRPDPRGQARGPAAGCSGPALPGLAAGTPLSPGQPISAQPRLGLVGVQMDLHVRRLSSRCCHRPTLVHQRDAGRGRLVICTANQPERVRNTQAYCELQVGGGGRALL